MQVRGQPGGCRAAECIAERAHRLAQAQRAPLAKCGLNIDSLEEGGLRAVVIAHLNRWISISS
ncbi:MAG: hypothetical protein JWQ03_1357, partial [Variovorax sp.]|nr:hypothetical protein [Variovorax sp.]